MSRKERKFRGFEEIQDETVKAFLDAQSEKTRKTYTSNMKKVLAYAKQSGKEILDDSEAWSRKIFAFQQSLIREGYALTSVQGVCGMLRGFFSFYKKPLDLSKTDKIKLGKKARNSEDYLFSTQDVKKLAENGSLKERYVLLAGVSFGLRAEDFASQLTYGKYRLALEKAQTEEISAPIPLGQVNTGKEKVLAFPMISSDALPIIQAILDAHKDAKDSELVFPEKASQTTAILQNLAFKSGLDAHGQRIRFHSLRKYLFDRLSSVASADQAKMIIGKKVDESSSPYLSTEKLREIYERAQPSIVISNGNGQVKKDLAETKSTVEQLIKMLAEKDEEIKTLKATIDNRFEELRREFFGETMKVKAKIVEPELKE
jgi:hypothetical protein